MWLIATTNLHTFLCKYKNDHKMSATTDLGKAFHFSSRLEAESYIANHIPKTMRKKYIVVKESDILEKEMDSKSITWLNLRANQNCEAFRTVSYILKHIPNYLKVLEAKRHEVEDALVDIYHYIEFTDIGTVQAYKIYKKEQELLRLRRQLKEEQLCADRLAKYIASGEANISEYVSALDKSKDRSYKPKILFELFNVAEEESQ